MEHKNRNMEFIEKIEFFLNKETQKQAIKIKVWSNKEPYQDSIREKRKRRGEEREKRKLKEIF